MSEKIKNKKPLGFNPHGTRNVQTLHEQDDKKFVAKYEKARDAYIDQYNQLSEDEQRIAIEDVSAKVGVDLGGPVTTEVPSTYFSGMIKRIVEQKVFTNFFEYPFTRAIEYTTVINGIKELFYVDVVQGSSALNNDIYVTISGEGTTPKDGGSDVEIKDFNGAYSINWREVWVTDFRYSRTFKMPSVILNDLTTNENRVAKFNTLYNLISEQIEQSERILLAQRAVGALFAKANHPTIKTFDGGKFPAVNPQVNEEDARKFYSDIWTQLKGVLYKLNTAGRDNLEADGGTSLIPQPEITTPARKPLYYGGQTGIKRYVFIDNTFAAGLQMSLAVNAFNLGELKDLYGDVEIIGVDMGAAKTEQLYQNYGTDPNSLGSVFNYTNWRTPLILVVDEGAIIDFQWFKGQKMTDTPKLYSISNSYMERGLIRRKDRFSAAFGLVNTTK